MAWFFKGGKEKREITKDEIERAVSQFLEEHNNVLYTVLVRDDYTVDYHLLQSYLPAVPTNSFLITRETLELFEDTPENRTLVRMIDMVQRAVDRYVTEKETFPIVEGDENYKICPMKLRSYLKEELSVDLYISEKHYLVTSSPDKGKRNRS